MKKSIFYYKELTAAEIGNTKTHERYIRFPNDFDYETFFNGEVKQNNTVIECTIEAKDLTNGSNNMVSLRFAYYINNSNKEKRMPSLGPLFDNDNVKEGDVVCLECRNIDDKINYFITFFKKGTITIYSSSLYFSRIEDKEQQSIISETKSLNIVQQIYFGAPGTGKSYAINQKIGENKLNAIRTTFHPDSDYSTFVGCYKPTMNSVEKQLYSKDELTSKLAEMKAQGVNYPSQKFGAKYWYSLKQLPASDKKEILSKCQISENFAVEIEKGIAIGEETQKLSGESHIEYSFVPQAFTKAYVAAWKDLEKPYYLVIEEINRGNCAQIFGDIFQLLDRDASGESSYAISPDNDLQKYLSEVLADSEISDGDIKSGKKMKLPSNLSIYATMNTSDQSLFPIDSAFKRRWDWKYIPINKDEEGHYIECGNEHYDWWNFLEKVNPKIDSTTGSEDKQLGFWFAKPEDHKGKISAEKFVSKVVFYLWNDVFKDYTNDSSNIFKTEDGLLKFRQFFDKDGNINLDVLKKFLVALKVSKLESETTTEE